MKGTPQLIETLSDVHSINLIKQFLAEYEEKEVPEVREQAAEGAAEKDV
jgi:hypothetical protein